MARVSYLHAPGMQQGFASAAESIRKQIIAETWVPDLNSFAASYGGRDLDASVLQMIYLRFLPLDDYRLTGTVNAIREGLSKDGWLFRYRLDDGFGSPKVAFIICTLWLVEALGDSGRTAEAKQVMDQVYSALTGLKLISEDFETTSLRMWGNFPQAYSHVGLIHAAFAASPPWADIL